MREINTSVKHFLLATSIAVCLASSCKNRTASTESPDFNELNWVSLDSLHSYFTFKHSDETLTQTDSVKINFVGRFNKDNSLTNSNLDSLASIFLSGHELGTFIISDSIISNPFKKIINGMAKHSVSYVKWEPDFHSTKPKEVIMKVYFKNHIDSILALQFASELKSQKYVQSWKYISKKQALETFSNEVGDFDKILEANPLPSSLEIKINPPFLNTKSFDSIKKLLIKDKRVDDVLYPSSGLGDSVETIKSLSEAAIIFKIET